MRPHPRIAFDPESTQFRRLRSPWLALRTLVILAMSLLLLATDSVHASPFGYSLNINFGPEPIPIGLPAGLARDRIWNNLLRPSSGGQPRPLEADLFGDNQDTPALVSWDSPAFGRSGPVEGQLGDMLMMEAFLESPSVIRIGRLDEVVPDNEDLTYTLTIFTHGGREGQEGSYRVNDRVREHVDNAIFDGEFREGFRGNYLAFPNLRDPEIFIETEGWGPVNAISLVYCRSGDFNGDGIIDVNDLDELNNEVKAGSGDRKYDVNLDLAVDWSDVTSWIKCSKGTCIGDVNLDGAFDSSDLVQLFAEGIYENGNKATWTTGDWNGDCVFDSSDLLLAFQEGCYDTGAAPVDPTWPLPWSAGGKSFELVTVPEPVFGLPVLIVWAVVARRRLQNRVG